MSSEQEDRIAKDREEVEAFNRKMLEKEMKRDHRSNTVTPEAIDDKRARLIGSKDKDMWRRERELSRQVYLANRRDKILQLEEAVIQDEKRIFDEKDLTQQEIPQGSGPPGGPGTGVENPLQPQHLIHGPRDLFGGHRRCVHPAQSVREHRCHQLLFLPGEDMALSGIIAADGLVLVVAVQINIHVRLNAAVKGAGMFSGTLGRKAVLVMEDVGMDDAVQSVMPQKAIKIGLRPLPPEGIPLSGAETGQGSQKGGGRFIVHPVAQTVKGSAGEKTAVKKQIRPLEPPAEKGLLLLFQLAGTMEKLPQQVVGNKISHDENSFRQGLPPLESKIHYTSGEGERKAGNKTFLQKPEKGGSPGPAMGEAGISCPKRFFPWRVAETFERPGQEDETGTLKRDVPRLSGEEGAF